MWLSDYAMPGMNGLQTLAALCRRSPDVRAFLFTAESIEPDHPTRHAAERVLRKPDEVWDLVRAVTAAVGVA